MSELGSMPDILRRHAFERKWRRATRSPPPGWVHPALGRDAGVLVHRPHDGVVRRVQAQPPHTFGHLRSGPVMEVIHDSVCHGSRSRKPTDARSLGDRHGHPWSLRGERSPPSSVLSGGGLRHRVDQQQHVIVVMRRGAGPGRSLSATPPRPNSDVAGSPTPAIWL